MRGEGDGRGREGKERGKGKGGEGREGEGRGGEGREWDPPGKILATGLPLCMSKLSLSFYALPGNTGCVGATPGHSVINDNPLEVGSLYQNGGYQQN